MKKKSARDKPAEQTQDYPGTPAEQSPAQEGEVPTISPGNRFEVLPLHPQAEPIPGYTLVKPLGRGGFGEVWQALGPGGFNLALKFIHLGDAGKLELRSLELMKEIQHPHLLPMFGAWQKAGYLIIAMEMASGTLLQKLREATREGRPGIPTPPLWEYMMEAAKGIDHLNSLNIQHRDIKPQNLLLVGGGVKVADFGLAKVLEHTITTASGSMTPAYAAPEFLEGQTSRWSDQYCLAATYCHLRANQLPFQGNPAQVVTGHLLKEPNLTMLPERERPIVARALAKEPNQRWPHCRAFVEALLGPSVSVPATPTAAKEVINSVGMKLVFLPAGVFAMGSPAQEKGRDAEELLHEVEITRPFYLSIYPVTQALYERVMGSNPSTFTANRGGGPEHPVEQVSWLDARTFCEKLSSLPEEQQRGRVYRLPTEAEWEYACRAGTGTPFSFGETLSALQANFDGTLPYGHAPTGPYRERTTKVGAFAPNAHGLYDMHGNVLEWCADWYDEHAYQGHARRDPTGPAQGELRVLRGGCWNYAGHQCRSAFRDRGTPDYHNDTIGFRVLLVVPSWAG
jgi:formylglycine-generating enzyme required for sulfatase activity